MMIALACAIFGALLGQAASPAVEVIPAGAMLGVLALWPATLLLRWLLAAMGGAARSEHGWHALSIAARDALGLLLPFALLAALAQWVLGWQAALAFLVAALGSSAAAAAAATIRLGAPPLGSALAGGLWALAVGAAGGLVAASLPALLAGMT